MHGSHVAELSLPFVESGAGEPLILLHGVNSNRFQYDVFRPLLGAGIRAVAYDQRDAPDCPSPDETYTAETHAGDLCALLDRLGLDSAHIMGVSYGGLIASCFAISHPGRCRSLILGSTAPATSLFKVRDFTHLREQGPEAVERYMLEAVLTPDAIDDDPGLVAEVRAALCTRTPEMLKRRMAAVEGHDVRDELHRISAPTLVLCGDDDPMLDPAVISDLANAIPGARLQMLEGSRHGITLQFRQRTAGLVRDFVLAHAVGDAA